MVELANVGDEIPVALTRSLEIINDARHRINDLRNERSTAAIASRIQLCDVLLEEIASFRERIALQVVRRRIAPRLIGVGGDRPLRFDRLVFQKKAPPAEAATTEHAAIRTLAAQEKLSHRDIAVRSALLSGLGSKNSSLNTRK